jgi:hypothetical protein
MAASGLLLAATSVVAGVAGTAHATTQQAGTQSQPTSTVRPACTPDPDGDCSHPNYQVWRTDGTLWIWTAPAGDGGSNTGRSVGGNGTNVEIDCQAEGSGVDGLPFTVWDHLDSGGWVYDYYITTPGNGFQLALTKC